MKNSENSARIKIFRATFLYYTCRETRTSIWHDESRKAREGRNAETQCADQSLYASIGIVRRIYARERSSVASARGRMCAAQENEGKQWRHEPVAKSSANAARCRRRRYSSCCYAARIRIVSGIFRVELASFFNGCAAVCLIVGYNLLWSFKEIL